MSTRRWRRVIRVGKREDSEYDVVPGVHGIMDRGATMCCVWSATLEDADGSGSAPDRCGASKIKLGYGEKLAVTAIATTTAKGAHVQSIGVGG
jgi:hypothetical protein